MAQLMDLMDHVEATSAALLKQGAMFFAALFFAILFACVAAALLYRFVAVRIDRRGLCLERPTSGLPSPFNDPPLPRTSFSWVLYFERLYITTFRWPCTSIAALLRLAIEFAITRLRALLSMPMAQPKFPNLQPFEV